MGILIANIELRNFFEGENDEIEVVNLVILEMEDALLWILNRFVIKNC